MSAQFDDISAILMDIQTTVSCAYIKGKPKHRGTGLILSKTKYPPEDAIY